MKRGSIDLARSLCFDIAGPTDEDYNDGRGYGSVDVAEILSAEVERLSDENTRLRAIIKIAAHDLEVARIWDGMGWDWSPLHPTIAKTIHDELSNGIKP